MKILPKGWIGLYRDDGIAVSSATKRQIDIMKKKICKVFEENGLKITIEANMKVVNFLDITFDLSTGVYKPFMKDNDIPVYVDTNSNHPPLVLKNIPIGVNKRLNRISSNREVFEAAKAPFQEALDKSGHKFKLEYSPIQDDGNNKKKKKKNRRKEAIWFNPPYSMNVKTKVGREFLSLLDRSFPPYHPLSKIFNRQTVKLSYKRMPNMAEVVSGQNTRKLRDDRDQVEVPRCNCRGGQGNCPVGGKCQVDCVIYEATITENQSGKKETYTGVTERPFKKRLYEHTTDMNCPSGRSKTSLSSHVWKLKDRGIAHTVTWRLKDRSTKFNPTSKKCRICLKEKFHILYNRDGASLNKRSEIFNSCIHRHSGLLENFKT